MYGMSGRFNNNSTRLPTYMEIITDQNISGRSSISEGPGETLSATNAPNNIAVVPEPGMPSVKSGTKEPVQAALLDASGAASPRTLPLLAGAPRANQGEYERASTWTKNRRP